MCAQNKTCEATSQQFSDTKQIWTNHANTAHYLSTNRRTKQKTNKKKGVKYTSVTYILKNIAHPHNTQLSVNAGVKLLDRIALHGFCDNYNLTKIRQWQTSSIRSWHSRRKQVLLYRAGLLYTSHFPRKNGTWKRTRDQHLQLTITVGVLLLHWVDSWVKIIQPVSQTGR